MYFYHLNWIQHSGYAAAMPLCGSAGSMGEWYRFLTTAIPCYCIFLEDVTCVSWIKYLYIYVHVYIYIHIICIYIYMYMHILSNTVHIWWLSYLDYQYHTWIGINQETLLFFLLWKGTELKTREMCSKHIFLLAAMPLQDLRGLASSTFGWKFVKTKCAIW